MAAPCFVTWNAAQPTTGIQTAGVATGGTGVVAMLQLKAGGSKLRVVEWGYSFGTVPTSIPVIVDLVTSATGLTMTTATQTADVLPYNDVGGTTQLAVGATTNSGYGAVGESGSATIRTIAKQYEFSSQFKQQFPLGREPEVTAGQFLRVRLSGVSLTASVYVIWEE